MAVNYATSLKNARLQEVIDAIGAGAGPGVLEIGNAGFASVLSTITLADPAFDAPAGGMMSLASTPRIDEDADASGTAAEARIKDSNGNVVVSGLTVGLADANIILSNTDILINQQVRLNSGTIIHG